MGSSLPTNTLDEELDNRIAELILQEARKKEARFSQTGTYSPQPTGNAARTNKRFLSSIIKSTDEHNKAVLRAQAESAAEVKQQIMRQEREERMKRAQEAATARAGRSMSSWEPRDYSKEERKRRSRSRSPDDRGRHRSSRHDRKRERSRGSEVDEDPERRSKRSRKDRSTSRRRSVTPRDEREVKRERRDKNIDPDERKKKESRRRHRDKSRSNSPKRRDKQDWDEEYRRRRRHSPERDEGTSSRRIRGSTPPSSKPPRSRLLKDALAGVKADRSGDHTHSTVDLQSKLESRARSKRSSVSPRPPEDSIDPDEVASESEMGPQPFELDKTYSSKMDKYFASDYDPRLDVESSLLDSSGLIPPGAFDNWDWMLQIVKARREEKEERKRLEKLHRSGKHEEPIGSSVANKEMVDALSMKYTKRGGVREWDEGKKEPT